MKTFSQVVLSRIVDILAYLERIHNEKTSVLLALNSLNWYIVEQKWNLFLIAQSNFHS